MNVMLLLEMAAGAADDRLALGERADGLSYGRLFELAGRAAAEFRSLGVERVVYVAESSPALPVALFGAAWAGLPFVPVNYRLADDRLRLIVERQVPAVVLCDAGTEHRFAGIDGLTLVTVFGFLTSISGVAPLPPEWSMESEDVALLLHTSGTSGEPKAAVLRHRHLTNYVIGSVEFLGAGEDEASLVSVPPYHIAGISAILTSVYGGRRLVQLPSFSPDEWVFIARQEKITHAMTVPTMLESHPRRARPCHRRRRPRSAVDAPPVVRRRTNAGAGDRASALPAARDRLRQRLWAHRDQLVDRQS